MSLYELCKDRRFKNILEFDFDENRVAIRSRVAQIKLDSNGVLYWMTRDQRVQGAFPENY